MQHEAEDRAVKKASSLDWWMERECNQRMCKYNYERIPQAIGGKM